MKWNRFCKAICCSFLTLCFTFYPLSSLHLSHEMYNTIGLSFQKPSFDLGNRAVMPRKESEHVSCTGQHSTFSLFHCQMQDLLTTKDSWKMTKTLRRLDYQPPRDMCPYLVGSYLPPWSHPTVEYKFSAQWCWHLFVELGSPLCQLVH